jgi:hypothetical protein
MINQCGVYHPLLLNSAGKNADGSTMDLDHDAGTRSVLTQGSSVPVVKITSGV